MAIILELMPVFARKPLWGYRLAVAGLLGMSFLSFFVWQHHLFVSRINADLRPFYMLSTEMISLPTGFIFLCAMGTLWRGRIRFTVPMLFCLAWVFNFLWGGISGVFNSDVPSDVTTHGSFFVMAHFHYTIMGGLIFAFFAAIYYWVPKMYGFKLNEKLGKVHFWVMFIAFNSTFAPLFGLGFMGMPRRVVPTRPDSRAERLGFRVGLRARPLDARVHLQRRVVSADQTRARGANPWHSKSAEWQLPTPVPLHDFERIPVFDEDPYPYGVDPAPAGVPAAAPAGGTHRSWKPAPPLPKPSTTSSPSPGSGSPARSGSAGGCCAARSHSSSPRSCSRSSICRRSTSTTTGRSGPFAGQGARHLDHGAVRGRRRYLPPRRQRPEVDELAAGTIAVLFTLAAVALQFFEYTQLGFGAASGGYAAVFFGWTSLYAIVALFGVYWIWIQVASLWRVRREGPRQIEIPAGEEELIRAGVEASSFYWAYFAAIGFVAWIILYYGS